MSTLIDDLMKGTEYEKQQLRGKRKRLLSAFDKYKTNVEYGIEEETTIQHKEILEWYRKLLDIETAKNAIENVPQRIKYYL